MKDKLDIQKELRALIDRWRWTASDIDFYSCSKEVGAIKETLRKCSSDVSFILDSEA